MNAAEAVQPVSGGSSILVVEDDVEVAAAIAGLLADEGYEVVLAGHGQQALELLEHRPVDLIVLDLRLPVMDGWQFRTVQRSHPVLSRIPVVAMSADGSPKAEAIDAAGYLRKPFQARDLLLTIERVLLAEQRRALADRLRETERLTTLGTIAATVGHEINNPLTYVLGNLHLLQAHVAERMAGPDARPDDTVLAELLAEVRLGADRIRAVADSLRVVSQRSDDRFVSLDINAVVRSAVAMTSQQIRQRARLRTELGELPPVLGSEARLGQVLVNLLVNAAQAIPPGQEEQHEVTVRTEASPDQVTIEVSDTGTGIPPAIQKRVFEAFFTTKHPSEGSGIGLTVSKKIVEEHRGRLELTSRPGAGTTVQVVLPLRPPTTPEPIRDRTAGRDPGPRPRPGRRGRVLLIDDDPLVLVSLGRVLQPEYRVVTAASGQAALDLLRAGQRFDVVVCDVMMPDMTGMKFSAEMERQRPGSGSRLIFITGAALLPEVEAFRAVTRGVWLEKPLEGDTLLASIRDLLDKVGLS